MKRLFFVLLFLLVEISVWTQNLVPNPSFETYTACPSSNSSEVYLATPWVEVQPTADYYNCSSLDNNYIARTGTGYMGVSVYRPDWGDTYREYLGVQLTQSLTAGVAYYGEFWVRLNPDKCWSSNSMGMYVSNGQPADPPFTQCLYVNPQIKNPLNRQLVGTEYWTKICGSFIAQGGENFISIGSFMDDQQTTFYEINPCTGSNGVHWSYYHIDDVLLEQYDSTANYDCDVDTTIDTPEPNDSTVNCNISIPNVYSPNGDQLNDYLDTDFPLEKYTFYIYDRWGKEMYYTWQDDRRDHHWDGRHEGKTVPDGVYFYILYSSTENCEQKGTITILR